MWGRLLRTDVDRGPGEGGGKSSAHDGVGEDSTGDKVSCVRP